MATVNNNDAFKALIAQVTALAATVTEIQASNETKMDALQATIEASANKATAAAFANILQLPKLPPTTTQLPLPISQIPLPTRQIPPSSSQL